MMDNATLALARFGALIVARLYRDKNNGFTYGQPAALERAAAKAGVMSFALMQGFRLEDGITEAIDALWPDDEVAPNV